VGPGGGTFCSQPPGKQGWGVGGGKKSGGTFPGTGGSEVGFSLNYQLLDKNLCGGGGGGDVKGR